MVNPWEKLPKLADLVIIVEDEKIKCHKIILASRSPLFLSMFEDEMDILIIESIDKTTLLDFLQHLYEPHIYMDKTKFTAKLLAVACRYSVESLLDKFADNFNDFITVENTFEAAFHITKTDSSRLLSLLANHIIKHFRQLQKHPDYLQLYESRKLAQIVLERKVEQSEYNKFGRR